MKKVLTKAQMRVEVSRGVALLRLLARVRSPRPIFLRATDGRLSRFFISQKGLGFFGEGECHLVKKIYRYHIEQYRLDVEFLRKLLARIKSGKIRKMRRSSGYYITLKWPLGDHWRCVDWFGTFASMEQVERVLRGKGYKQAQTTERDDLLFCINPQRETWVWEKGSYRAEVTQVPPMTPPQELP